jgi:ParB-like chromosome segregation protein Spo0J
MEVYRQELMVSALEPSPELIEVQALMPIDPSDRERLKEDIAKDGIRDAIKVYRNGNKYYILGGYNRWRIAQEVGIKTVPVEIYYLQSEEERRDLVIKDNLNRRHLTREQKQRLIEYFLKKEPYLSNRAIAEKSKSDDKTVAKVRKSLESTAEIPQLDKRVGQDGKQRKSETQKSTFIAKRTKNIVLSEKLTKHITSYLNAIKSESDRQAIKAMLIKFIKEL